MAIDTKSLTQLITEFRALQAKDSVSPDSLGYILQRIADLLATAGTSETVTKIQTLLDGFKAAGYALTSIAQGQSDRNHVYANVGKVNLSDGSTSTASSILIQQATTERAGAMRAQQVTDLNAAKRGVTDLQTKVSQLESLLNKLSEEGVASSSAQKYHISCEIVGNTLVIHGAKELHEAGYVPYIFRHTRKRNKYNHNGEYRPDDKADKKYCAESKGWHCFGSAEAVMFNGRRILFSTTDHAYIHAGANGYSLDPTNLIKIHTSAKGFKSVAWGRSRVKLVDRHGNARILRLRFAIGFATRLKHGHKAMHPSYMLSNLAEFSLAYDPKTASWSLSR